jgi:hypothetical protein
VFLGIRNKILNILVSILTNLENNIPFL